MRPILFMPHVDDLRLKYRSEVEAFAKRDGFDNVTDFISFFAGRYKLPFDGDVYRWRLV